MARPKCTATTKKGNPCPMPAMDGRDMCPAHLAASGDPEAVAAHQARSSAGGKRSIEILRGENRESISLRCYEDVAREYERLAIRAENGLDPARVKAVCSVIDSARAAWHSGVLETENAELKAELVKLRPELAKHLKVVK